MCFNKVGIRKASPPRVRDSILVLCHLRRETLTHHVLRKRSGISVDERNQVSCSLVELWQQFSHFGIEVTKLPVAERQEANHRSECGTLTDIGLNSQ